MPTLSYVYPYPAQGRADRPTDDDPVADIAIRGCRSIAELYSEALAALALPARVGELRLFIHHDPQLDMVRATVQLDPVWEGFEMAHVSVPTGFAARTPEVRAHMLLEAVHGLLGRLAVARGWDVGALADCRQYVLDRDQEYRWSSGPKISPDRRHEARADFRLTADGYGRVRLRVVRRDDGTTVAFSGEALAFCTGASFRRAAKSLHWHGKERVSLVPYDWVPAVRGGELGLSLEGGEWRSSVVDLMSVRSVPAGDPTLPPLPVRVEGRGAAAAEQPPRIVFVGGGPIQTRAIGRFHDAFSTAMARFASPSGQEWWQDAGIRLLEVQINYASERVGVRSRRSEHRLRVFVDRPESSLGHRDPAPLAREVAAEVVALVRRRTGLGPHPDFAAP
ncbi:hypothetical protein [Nocardioides ochotonae]|uniref:hypothetical protein n=1 Tax=Nocardioides ochotonae TaxID=2685869 RepID=UPI001408089A|nr:hypothetical protein [Nocardioides ochotonae]